MRIALQRVRQASVEIDGRIHASIGQGVLALVGFGEGDQAAILDKIADKMVGLRLFSDEGGNTNRSLEEIGGDVLLVSQFTLYADIRKGRRPSFSRSLPPTEAQALYETFVETVRQRVPWGKVDSGVFGAMMQVHLINDGPVTIWLDSSELNT